MARRVTIFVLALIFWAAIFYTMNRNIMELQGLPVGHDLMPV